MTRAERLPIEIAASDLDGESNHDGIYLGALLPAMEAMKQPNPSEDSWTANPQLTETQVTLGLCGYAHLELLNGGPSQLVFNQGLFARDVPAAFERLGWSKAAGLARDTILPAAQAPPRPSILDGLKDLIDRGGRERRQWNRIFKYEPSADAAGKEAELAKLLETKEFYERVVAAIRADQAGFRVTES